MKRITILLVAGLLIAGLLVTSLAHAAVVLRPLTMDAKRGPNRVINAGFEEFANGKLVGWNNQLAEDWAADEQVAHSGKVSLRMAKTAAGTLYWVSQTVELNQTRPQPLIVGAWSKTV